MVHVVRARALSHAQVVEIEENSRTAVQMARDNERIENDHRAAALQAQIDAEIAAAGGLSRMSQRDADRLWGRNLKILRLRG
jgi:hypothetical protein